jgi:hypothetical protein
MKVMAMKIINVVSIARWRWRMAKKAAALWLAAKRRLGDMAQAWRWRKMAK